MLFNNGKSEHTQHADKFFMSWFLVRDAVEVEPLRDLTILHEDLQVRLLFAISKRVGTVCAAIIILSAVDDLSNS